MRSAARFILDTTREDHCRARGKYNNMLGTSFISGQIPKS